MALFLNKGNKFNSLFLSLFVVAFSFVAFTVLLDEVKNNQDIRSRAGGSTLSREVFCKGKELCGDGHCVGETWRECKPCPAGTARAAYKISCDENSYSECNLDDTICDD